MIRCISILGCGWLGKPLGATLLSAGYDVHGSTTREERLSEIRELGIKAHVIQFEPHLAGRDVEAFFESEILIISLPPRRRAGKTDYYLKQMHAVAQEALRGAISKVLMISSTSVYPNLNGIVTEEDADPDVDLVKAERLVLENFNATILRFGGLYGPGRHPGKFLAGKKDVEGGNHPINMIHQDDCIAIITRIIEQDVWGQVFSACSDHHPIKKEFYAKAAQELSLEPPTFSHNDNGGWKIVSNEKLKKHLGYSFRN